MAALETERVFETCAPEWGRNEDSVATLVIDDISLVRSGDSASAVDAKQLDVEAGKLNARCSSNVRG